MNFITRDAIVAIVGACALSPLAPAPAQAAMQTCWASFDNQATWNSEPCDVRSRVNANNHEVWDISVLDSQGNNQTFHIVLFNDGTADVIADGNVMQATTLGNDKNGTHLLIPGPSGNMNFIF